MSYENTQVSHSLLELKAQVKFFLSYNLLNICSAERKKKSVQAGILYEVNKMLIFTHVTSSDISRILKSQWLKL